MSLEVKIHEAQTAILRELLFHKSSDYSQLQKLTGFSSDHFNFHIKRLVEIGLVQKINRGKYELSMRGKEYANRLDTDDNTIERQPKIAVIFALERKINGKVEYLFQERLKNPYFGYWGLPSGKVRWGETITETALRESIEETGLTADFKVAGVYHELVRVDDEQDKIEDKIFFVCKGTKVRGKLIEDFEGGRNVWMSFEEAYKKVKKFESFKQEIDILNSKNWLSEQVVLVDAESF
jgi:ADP-ribose pyrophosphatase YjhB (NUDIX family)